MNRQQWTLLGGAGLGAGLGAGIMYLLDPQQGRRRRALARDKAVHGMRLAGTALGKTSRDVGNRTRGLAARLEGRLKGDGAGDEVIAERVRARLGHVVSHPGAIEVRVEDGHARLSGPVLADEVDEVLTSVRRVRGVRAVESRLEVHAEPGDVPGLQGEPARPARRGLLQRGPVGAALGAVGVGLLARGLRSGAHPAGRGTDGTPRGAQQAAP